MFDRDFSVAVTRRWLGAAIVLLCLLVALILLYSPAAAEDGQGTGVLSVTKTATPDSVQEPGWDVEFGVLVENTSGMSVTITSLDDSSVGDLNTFWRSACSVPQELAPAGEDGSTYSCTFSVFVTGDPGTYVNTVTVSGLDSQGEVVTASGSAEVEIVDRPWFIEVSKSVWPTTLIEPGGLVTYTITLSNPSRPGGPADITSLLGDEHGDLWDQSNDKILNSTCEAVTLQPGETYSCTYQVEVSGKAGDRITSVITVTSLMRDPASAAIIFVGQPPPTGAGVAPSFIAGLFAAGGTAFVAASAWVRRRTR